GTANPTPTASFSGFVNGQTLATSGVTGSPGLSTTATPTSSVAGSPYPITVTVGTLSSANYSFSLVPGTLTVTKATPVLTWSNPAAISYPTPLGAAQLNAAADVPGAFTYTPTNGTVLDAGAHTLTASFSPTDFSDYNNATGTVSLTVRKGTPTLSWNPPATISCGTALSSAQLNATANV